MRAALMVSIPMLVALAGCESRARNPLGSSGPGYYGNGDYSIFYDLRFLATDQDVRMRVGESRHFTVRITDEAFASVRWTVAPDAGGGQADLLGFACVPTASCGLEGIASTAEGAQATLRVRDTKQIVARVAALGKGVVTLTVRGDAAPCGATFALSTPKCGQHDSDTLSFAVDP